MNCGAVWEGILCIGKCQCREDCQGVRCTGCCFPWLGVSLVGVLVSDGFLGCVIVCLVGLRGRAAPPPCRE